MKGLLVTCGLLASCVSGHIQMSKPYPIRSPLNPNGSGQKDYSYTSPLSTSGSDYPCKGYANDPFAPVADYSPGQTYELELQGSATHGGGSCQISLSYDQGQSFKVIHSILGGCPINLKYNFQIPSDAPSGEALLAWSWFNKVGNREMYMNCAQVTIKGGSQGRQHARDMSPMLSARAGGFDSLPPMFQANNGGPGHCKTVEGEEVNFPLPGPSVEGSLSGKGYKCESSASFLGSGDSSSKSPLISSSAAATKTHAPKVSSSVASPSSSSVATPSSTPVRVNGVPVFNQPENDGYPSTEQKPHARPEQGYKPESGFPFGNDFGSGFDSENEDDFKLDDDLNLEQFFKPEQGFTPEQSFGSENGLQPEHDSNPEHGSNPEHDSNPEHGPNTEHGFNPEDNLTPTPTHHGFPDTCRDGEILCGPGGMTWAMCNFGKPVQMGLVAAGTRCRHGVISYA